MSGWFSQGPILWTERWVGYQCIGPDGQLAGVDCAVVAHANLAMCIALLKCPLNVQKSADSHLLMLHTLPFKIVKIWHEIGKRPPP